MREKAVFKIKPIYDNFFILLVDYQWQIKLSFDLLNKFILEVIIMAKQ